MSTSVKHIHSGMRGVPSFNNAAVGGLIAALDSVLLTGWGTTTALSGSVSGGVATIVFNAATSFDKHAVVLVDGATPTEVNGEFRVTESTSDSISYPTAAADGVITGTVVVKYAPQTTWEKAFSGTDKAAYRSTDVQSKGHFLRVDDSSGMFARVRGFEEMSDIDTGSGPFPTDAQMSGGGYWHKTASNVATKNNWLIVCDGMFLVVIVAPLSWVGALDNSASSTYGFGDPISLSPSGDAWGTILTCGGEGAHYHSRGNLFTVFSFLPDGAWFFPRNFAGTGGSVMGSGGTYSGDSSNANNATGFDPTFGPASSTLDGKMFLSRRFARQGTVNGGTPRSTVPGILYIPHTGALSVISHRDVADVEIDGVHLAAMGVALNAGAQYTHQCLGLVDITGPWR